MAQRAGEYMTELVDAAYAARVDQIVGQLTPKAMEEAAARGAELIRQNPELAKIARRYSGHTRSTNLRLASLDGSR